MNNGHAIEPQSAGGMVAIIERAALNPDIDVIKMQQLLDMQERIITKQAEIEFNQSMAALQPLLPAIHKSKKGHNSNYAPYDEIDKVVRPLYTAHGFSISFDSKKDGGVCTYYATVSHKAGHSKTAQIELPSDTSGSKNAIQAMGSAISYAKRYLICMLFNIVTTDEDTDGSDVVTHEQAVEIDLLINEVKADKPAFLKILGVDDVRNIPAASYQSAIIMLKQKKGKK